MFGKDFPLVSFYWAWPLPQLMLCFHASSLLFLHKDLVSAARLISSPVKCPTQANTPALVISIEDATLNYPSIYQKRHKSSNILTPESHGVMEQRLGTISAALLNRI